MSWVRIDDQAPLHPKLLAAGPEAVCLWLAGLCYANAHTTDGYVPKHVLGALYPSDRWDRRRATKASADLVAVGLWHDEPSRWRIHGYSDYQEEALRENVDERREYEKLRKRKQRQDKKNAYIAALSRGDTAGQSSGTPAGQEKRTGWDTSEGESRPDTSVVSQPPGPALPVPTRPVPKRASHAKSAREGAAGVVQVSYSEAIYDSESGAHYDFHDGDAGHFTRACQAIQPFTSDSENLRDMSLRWAVDFKSAFDIRTPKLFADYCTSRAANGGIPVVLRSKASAKTGGWQAPASADDIAKEAAG